MYNIFHTVQIYRLVPSGLTFHLATFIAHVLAAMSIKHFSDPEQREPHISLPCHPSDEFFFQEAIAMTCVRLGNGPVFSSPPQRHY